MIRKHILLKYASQLWKTCKLIGAKNQWLFSFLWFIHSEWQINNKRYHELPSKSDWRTGSGGCNHKSYQEPHHGVNNRLFYLPTLCLNHGILTREQFAIGQFLLAYRQRRKTWYINMLITAIYLYTYCCDCVRTK